jgi:hypothetical protein
MGLVKRLWLIAAVAPSLAIFGQNMAQNAPKIAPIPADPLELVTGPVEVANSRTARAAAVELLDRARTNYALRSARQAYDLKISFTVNSGGQTEYDGAWQMEEMYDPQQGTRWTAQAAAGYATTQISSKDMSYGEGTSSVIPLRLHEARAAMLGPMPDTKNVELGLIRTSTVTFNGAQLTCVLLSGSGNPGTATPGRRWEETEECIDPKSGLLVVHSQAPGRYYAYDYANAPQFSGHTLARRVTVTEAGKPVSEIRLESLTEIPPADPSLFVATESMRSSGPAIAMGGAQKISKFAGRGPLTSAMTAQPVCVFGLVTASGQLVEAHSLQPSDPNSQAAVEAAKQINFAGPAQLGTRPQQHFVFIIEKFVSGQPPPLGN